MVLAAEATAEAALEAALAALLPNPVTAFHILLAMPGCGGGAINAAAGGVTADPDGGATTVAAAAALTGADGDATGSADAAKPCLV